MASYTTWQKVVDLYPRAADVESDSDNQTALIVAKSNLFHSFIRGIHKDDLTSPYDEPVKEAVALLVVDELRRRTQTDDERGSATAVDDAHDQQSDSHRCFDGRNGSPETDSGNGRSAECLL